MAAPLKYGPMTAQVSIPWPMNKYSHRHHEAAFSTWKYLMLMVMASTIYIFVIELGWTSSIYGHSEKPDCVYSAEVTT